MSYIEARWVEFDTDQNQCKMPKTISHVLMYPEYKSIKKDLFRKFCVVQNPPKFKHQRKQTSPKRIEVIDLTMDSD